MISIYYHSRHQYGRVNGREEAVVDVKEIRASKINGIVGLIVFITSILHVSRAESNYFYTVELINKPLILSPILNQQALANSSFSFNLQPFVNKLKPEINYQITFVWPLSKDVPNAAPFYLKEPPVGFTQINDGENTCAKPFKLKYNQSCIMRFYVDKDHYVYSATTVDKHGNRTLGKSTGPYITNGLIYAHVSPEANFHAALQDVAEPTQFLVTPTGLDGLGYDPSSLSIVGTPTRIGMYHFTISATDGKTITEPKSLDINVDINPHDKPVFKENYSLASAMPEQHYRLNLMELIESTPGFAVTNQVSFRIYPDEKNPPWLSLDKETSTILQGQVPSSDGGQIKEVTLIATSNTGGDSLPMTIQIPVAFDIEIDTQKSPH